MTEQQEIDQDLIISAVNKALDNRDSIDKLTHRKHHDFIDSLIQAKEKKLLRWEKIRVQVTGWSIITVLSGLGAAVYNFFIKNTH
jgi:hypothetical protein